MVHGLTTINRILTIGFKVQARLKRQREDFYKRMGWEIRAEREA